MAAVDDFELVVEPYHQALGKIVKGNPEGYKQLYSHRDDVTLANPFGPPARGGSRLLQPWSVPHRSSEMEKLLASRG